MERIKLEAMGKGLEEQETCELCFSCQPNVETHKFSREQYGCTQITAEARLCPYCRAKVAGQGAWPLILELAERLADVEKRLGQRGDF